MTVSCNELRARARAQLKGRYDTSIAVSFVASFITSLCSLFLFGAMEYGVAGYYLNQQRGKETKFLQIFDGFENYLAAFVAGLLINIFTFLWSLLLFIPGIIKAIAYGMTFYVMRDFNLDATAAITKSRELMYGYKWKYFKLRLSFLGWIILSMFTFGIGSIFLAPYMAAADAEFYAELLRCNGISLEGESTADLTF